MSIMENILEKLDLRFPETEGEMRKVIEKQCGIFGDRYDFYDDLYVWSGNKSLLAAFCGEEAVGAVSFPEISYTTKGNTFKGGYIFAAWVSPEYRGMGIFSLLMDKAESLMLERGYSFAFVVPAEKALFPMYEKLGYTVEAENGFPYSASREILREYNPTDDIYMLWKVYSRIHDTIGKDMEFFNHAMRVMEEEGKCFAISKRGYVVYAPRYDNTITVYDRMENGSLRDGGKRTVRGLCKMLGGDKAFEKTTFNAFFEPTYEIFKK